MNDTGRIGDDDDVNAPFSGMLQFPKDSQSREAEKLLAPIEPSKEIFANQDLSGGGKPLEPRITDVTEEAVQVTSVAAQSGIRKFPNPGLAVMREGARQERLVTQEMIGVTESIDKVQDKLKAMLSFNQILTRLPTDKEVHDVTEEMRECLKLMKDLDVGLEVLTPEEKTITKEKLLQIKADIDAMKSKLNTDNHLYFNKFGRLNTKYNNLLEILRTIEKYVDRLIQKIIDLSTKH